MFEITEWETDDEDWYDEDEDDFYLDPEFFDEEDEEDDDEEDDGYFGTLIPINPKPNSPSFGDTINKSHLIRKDINAKRNRTTSSRTHPVPA